MDSKVLVCVVVVVLSCLLTESEALTSHAEFKRRMLSFNPTKLTAHCKKVFRSCGTKMFALIGLLDVIKDRWEEYNDVPCVKIMMANNYPDYTLECSRSGRYGQFIGCVASPEATAFLDDKHLEPLRSALNCLLDNSLP
ncbi:unnamed protein product [Ixodes hexagonus]